MKLILQVSLMVYDNSLLNIYKNIVPSLWDSAITAMQMVTFNDVEVVSWWPTVAETVRRKTEKATSMFVRSSH